MSRYELASAATRDLLDILAWSELRHGTAARTRYQRLIAAAFRDVSANPYRLGHRVLSSTRPDLLVYHLRHSRERGRRSGMAVLTPRHIIVYRADRLVTILRVLHDSMDLIQRVTEEPGEAG